MFTCVGRLMSPEGRVSSLNKSNPIQSNLTWTLRVLQQQPSVIPPGRNSDSQLTPDLSSQLQLLQLLQDLPQHAVTRAPAVIPASSSSCSNRWRPCYTPRRWSHHTLQVSHSMQAVNPTLFFRPEIGLSVLCNGYCRWEKAGLDWCTHWRWSLLASAAMK